MACQTKLMMVMMMVMMLVTPRLTSAIVGGLYRCVHVPVRTLVVRTFCGNPGATSFAAQC